MARNRGKSDSNGSGTPDKGKDVEWYGFIDFKLSDDQKEQFLAWSEETRAVFWGEFVEWVQSGLKFSLSYEGDGDFFTATFTGHGVNVVGFQGRACLTARAPEWETAVMLLVFKHSVLMDGTWKSWKPGSRTFERFG